MAAAILPAVVLSASPSPRRRKVSEIDLNNLSRTTAWRARKRGWACPEYHQRQARVCDPEWFERNIELAQRIARNTAIKVVRHARPLPAYISMADIRQEILLYLLERTERLKEAEGIGLWCAMAWEAACRLLPKLLREQRVIAESNGRRTLNARIENETH